VSDEYTPVILVENSRSARVTFALELDKCPSCQRLMMRPFPTPDSQRWDRYPFPREWRNNLDAQMKRAGLVYWGAWSRKYDARICEVCTASGLDIFICALCGQERGIDQIKEQFGDPPEYLCQVCYETRPAKEWHEAIERLEEEHRYDFS
jgi:hypothetical protein